MKTIFNKISNFLILFFFYFGLGCFSLQFFFDAASAIQLSILVSVIVSAIEFAVDYIKYEQRSNSAFREDDLDQDDVHDYIVSPQFQKDLSEQITNDTWNHPTKDGRGLPKVYLDKKGDLVKHWKDGTIEIIEEDLLKNK